ncbi:hydroxyacylglutathione hydrolase [Mongoliimonas terrestris]|uniref:hydroxyacylglutathione hydrolase n=1 Tax=Mongoliimonas terrestris TaxID=1709001 RepID=UPI00094976F1|nr:hydroxyacylglutathione hydrolase [Mongoliimonas terrestris]
MPPVIDLIPCLRDNYAVLVHDPASGTTLLVDAPEEAPVAAALRRRGWTLTHILITHHHHDHVTGLMALKDETGALVLGPAEEADRIAGLDRTLEDGDVVEIGPWTVDAIRTPGHTLGHLCYHLPSIGLAFTGDTLFALGCGRVFEGTLDAMWGSLDRLKTVLPPETIIYCGHEYTLSNARFAVSMDPGNTALQARATTIAAAREAGRPTLPTTMADELATNPFLRADDPALATAVGMAGAAPAAVFAHLRRRKDAA